MKLRVNAEIKSALERLFGFFPDFLTCFKVVIDSCFEIFFEFYDGGAFESYNVIDA